MPPAERHDADDLVVRAALGEQLTDDERERLEADPQLQDEVAEFAEIVELAREAPDDIASAGRLDHLWDGIAAEAFGPRADTADGMAQPSADALPMRSRTSWWVGLAAVVAAAAAVVALVTVGPLSPDPEPPPIAAADLQPFGDAEVSPVEGSFVLSDGTPLLQVDLSDLPSQPDAFYEVWLLDPEEGRLVSLGPVRPDGTYALPAGTAVDDFPAVDVSVEPRDGDPTHSGASVLRGPVQARA